MAYVDGFVLPIPADKIEDYRAIASKAGEVWMEHGALAYHECLIDDAEAHGCLPFPALAGVKDGETVVFAYILYESRERRDEVNKKVMADPRIADQCGDMPFDHKRMACGGFTSLVDLG